MGTPSQVDGAYRRLFLNRKVSNINPRQAFVRIKKPLATVGSEFRVGDGWEDKGLADISLELRSKLGR